MDLLKKLQEIYAPAGEEDALRDFILQYISENKNNWKVQPEVVTGKQFQNCIALVFGKPRTAVFAHMDSIGFTVRYNNNLIKLGGPVTNNGIELWGYDKDGLIETKLVKDEDSGALSCDFERTIEPGTNLVFKPNWREDEESISNCYMDNRLGCYNVLKLAETLEDGILFFSCWEETGGGSIGYLAQFMYEQYGVQQALISDITWITEGVQAGKGVAVSMRDSGIPRKKYINKVKSIAQKSGIPYQLEVESSGGSDGNQLQKSHYPIDWCFIGAAEENVHSPDEKVHKEDIRTMLELYQVLMQEL
jgi:putative aminopeptidase FrvX